MTEAIDLTVAAITGGADIRKWPITTDISQLATGPHGIDVAFGTRDSADWPDIVPATWGGPVYYTVWLGARLADGIHLAASLNVYRGQAGAGAGDVTNIGQYSANLWYLDPALKAHVVTEGETLYLMVTAGGLRGVSAVSVQERSNVVAFTASSAPRTFTYGQPVPIPTPTPVPTPEPSPPVDVVTKSDLAASEARIIQRINDVETEFKASTIKYGTVIATVARLFGVKVPT